MRDVAPRTRDRPTVEELADRSLRRLARGGTCEGLANEIAWKAVAATRADTACVEWLSELVDGVLSERAEGLEFVLDREQADARAEHLREWPQDLAGAENRAGAAPAEIAAAAARPPACRGRRRAAAGGRSEPGGYAAVRVAGPAERAPATRSRVEPPPFGSRCFASS
jgi:hypothetical protein